MSLRQFISTRKLLRSLNLAKDNVTLKWKEIAVLFGLQDDLFENPRYTKIGIPVTAILIGAGHRGMIYADYATKNPDELTIVAVADPDIPRRAKAKQVFELKKNTVFRIGKKCSRNQNLLMP